LMKEIRWGRILNVAKTLRSLRADVIEVQNPDGANVLYTGRLMFGSARSLTIGGRKYDRSDLRKVAMIGADKYVVFKLKSGTEEFADAEIIDHLFSPSSIQFEDGITGEEREIETNKIRDIIFARRPYWPVPD